MTVALLKGLLEPILGKSLNYINTPHLANQRGITVSQATGSATLDYPNLISCRAFWEGDSRLVVATSFHADEPRVLYVDNYRLDVIPEGRVLVLDSIDVPGLIGKIGTILGTAGINIASMRFGRTGPYKQALSFIKIDQEVTEEVIAEILAFEPIRRVRQVIL
jgi:D-3-phosphoglycerate dehydrogenase